MSITLLNKLLKFHVLRFFFIHSINEKCALLYCVIGFSVVLSCKQQMHRSSFAEPHEKDINCSFPKTVAAFRLIHRYRLSGHLPDVQSPLEANINRLPWSSFDITFVKEVSINSSLMNVSDTGRSQYNRSETYWVFLSTRKIPINLFSLSTCESILICWGLGCLHFN